MFQNTGNFFERNRQHDALSDLNKAAFDSFDDYEGDGYDDYDPDNLDDSYDPDNYEDFDEFGRKRKPGAGMRGMAKKASGLIRQSPARRKGNAPTPSAQFDISIVSTFAQAFNIELFNAQNSITEFQNNTTNNGYVPAGAMRQQALANDLVIGNIQKYTVGAGVTTGYVIYFDSTGNLVYQNFSDSTVGVATVTISCKQIPYRSLLKYSERGSFKVNKMRMKFTTTGQINNDITHQTKTFLGATKTNQISVSSYFRPDQFQGLLVDVPVSYRIDAEKGLLYTVNANETVLINMFVSEYSKSAL